MLCPYCEKETKPSAHIYYCAKKHDLLKEKKEVKYDYLIFNFPFMCKKFLEEKYIEENWSLPDFKKEYSIDFKSVTFLLDYYEINRRSLKESSKLISVSKYKKTCLNKYGVDNVSKIDLIKEKKSKTFLKNYSVDNIFKDTNFKKYIKENNFAWKYDESNKRRSINQSKSIRKYWNNLPKGDKKNILNKRKRGYYNWLNSLSDDEHKAFFSKICYTSKLEDKICDVLSENNIEYNHQFFLNKKSYDFRIKGTNILLEVQGDYWHANPNFYKHDDIISNKKASEIWKIDMLKKSLANKSGYNVIYIWEEDIKSLSNEELFNLIIKNC